MNWIEQSWRDLQVGVRSLAKTPAFTVLAVSSLALGIMTTTAIYSVLYAVVLDPFPYKNVDDLTSVLVRNPAQRGMRLTYSVDQFVEIAERSRVFDGVIASTISDVVWTSEGDPQRLRGNHGTFNTFDVMGVPPLLGRTPTASDAQPGAEPVAVLGYQFWQRQFGGDPNRAGTPPPAERHRAYRHRCHAEAVHVAGRRRVPADPDSSEDESSKGSRTCTCSAG